MPLDQIRQKFRAEQTAQLDQIRQQIKRRTLRLRGAQANVQHLITIVESGETLPDHLLDVIEKNCALCLQTFGKHCEGCGPQTWGHESAPEELLGSSSSDE